MAPRTTFNIHDRHMDGRLEKLLRSMRKKGLTYDQMSEELRVHDVYVNRSTVNRWCQLLDIT